MSIRAIKTLFLIGGIYDVVLGVVFCLFFKPIYNLYSAALPNHDGYIQLPALLIAVFGIGFFYVAKDPVKNSAIIVMAILMKLVYIAVVVGHKLLGDMPGPYLPFAVMDMVFVILFVSACTSICRLDREGLQAG